MRYAKMTFLEKTLVSLFLILQIPLGIIVLIIQIGAAVIFTPFVILGIMFSKRD
jgi:hypothetical protein